MSSSSKERRIESGLNPVISSERIIPVNYGNYVGKLTSEEHELVLTTPVISKDRRDRNDNSPCRGQCRHIVRPTSSASQGTTFTFEKSDNHSNIMKNRTVVVQVQTTLPISTTKGGTSES